MELAELRPDLRVVGGLERRGAKLRVAFGEVACRAQLQNAGELARHVEGVTRLTDLLGGGCTAARWGKVGRLADPQRLEVDGARVDDGATTRHTDDVPCRGRVVGLDHT